MTRCGARFLRAFALVPALLFLSACKQSPEARLRRQLALQTTGTINLPPGVIDIPAELELAPGAHDLDIVGSGTILKASDQFQGRAILVASGSRNIRLRDFTMDGNRPVLEKPLDGVPADSTLREYSRNNAVLLDGVDGAEVSNLTLANIAGFAILVSRSARIRMHHLHVEDCGSLDSQGHNTATGGVALEEGTRDFEVRSSIFRRIRGTALWTRSLRASPRAENGVFASNSFDSIGRAAIVIGNAAHMLVEENSGRRIGYPVEAVDPLEQPAALASTGDVDRSTFVKNQFEDVDGKCLDLDGFHDGAVIRNTCVNRRPPAEYPYGHFGIAMNNTVTQPANIEIAGNTMDGTRYGALFLIGGGHRVIGNFFTHLNKAECPNAGCVSLRDEPEMLDTAIYLGRGAARHIETRGNIIRDNTISGYKMQRHCFAAAPGVWLRANTLSANQCSDYSTAR
jgi:hypothetical protein